MVRHLFKLHRHHTDLFFVVGKDLCDGCAKELPYQAFHITTADLPLQQEWLLCHHCMRAPPHTIRFSKQREIRTVLLAQTPPAGSLPVLASAEYQYSQRLNLFTAVTPDGEKHIEADTAGVQVVDRTRFAGRDGYTLSPDAQIGLRPDEVDALDAWKEDTAALLEFLGNPDGKVLLPKE